MATKNGIKSEGVFAVKEQVLDDTPKVIKGLQFGVLSVAFTAHSNTGLTVG